MGMTPSSDSGRPSGQKAEFMLIEIGYSCKLLFTIEKGTEFLSAYCHAQEWKSGYKEPTEILPSPPKIELKYLTRADIAKIQFDKTIGLDGDD